MDFMPDKEFHVIFVRVARKVNLKGCYTPKAIDEKLRHVEKAHDFALKSGYIKDEKTKRRFKRGKKNMRQLRKSGFAERVIALANRHPDGIYGLTLQHGYAKAKEKLLARKRRLKRMIRVRRRRVR